MKTAVTLPFAVTVVVVEEALESATATPSEGIQLSNTYPEEALA
jgi:hypothetical protein